MFASRRNEIDRRTLSAVAARVRSISGYSGNVRIARRFTRRPGEGHSVDQNLLAGVERVVSEAKAVIGRDDSHALIPFPEREANEGCEPALSGETRDRTAEAQFRSDRDVSSLELDACARCGAVLRRGGVGKTAARILREESWPA
jgi:hypothetical protein